MSLFEQQNYAFFYKIKQKMLLLKAFCAKKPPQGILACPMGYFQGSGDFSGFICFLSGNFRYNTLLSKSKWTYSFTVFRQNILNG
jgi:hypothetical protein